MELSVLSGQHIDTYAAGFVGHVLRGGELQIVDSARGIVATYPSSSLWTIVVS